MCVNLVMDKDYRCLLVCEYGDEKGLQTFTGVCQYGDGKGLQIFTGWCQYSDEKGLQIFTGVCQDGDGKGLHLLVCVSVVMEKGLHFTCVCQYGGGQRLHIFTGGCQYGDGKGLQSFTGGCQYGDALSLGDSAPLSRWGTLRQGRHNDDLIRAEKESSIIISPLKMSQGSWHEWWRMVATVGSHPQQPRYTDKTLGTEIMISLYGC